MPSEFPKLFPLLAMLLALATPIALSTACGSSGGDDDDTGNDDDDTGSDDDDTTSDDDDATPAPEGSLSGRVVDLSGAPLANIGVSCCSDQTCLTATTDADGDFLIEGLAANTYVVDNLGYPGSDAQAAAMSWSKFFDFVTIGVDETVILERDLVLAEAAEPQQVVGGANNFSYQGGLAVSFDGSALSLPFLVGHFTNDDDEDNIANYLDADANLAFEVSAIELPESAWPVGGLDGDEIKKAWVFAPFETALEEGAFTVTMTFDAAIPAGNSVSLLWADYDLGTHAEHFERATATVNADGLSVTGEIAKLSLVLLVAAGR